MTKNQSVDHADSTWWARPYIALPEMTGEGWEVFSSLSKAKVPYKRLDDENVRIPTNNVAGEQIMRAQNWTVVIEGNAKKFFPSFVAQVVGQRVKKVFG